MPSDEREPIRAMRKAAARAAVIEAWFARHREPLSDEDWLAIEHHYRTKPRFCAWTEYFRGADAALIAGLRAMPQGWRLFGQSVEDFRAMNERNAAAIEAQSKEPPDA